MSDRSSTRLNLWPNFWRSLIAVLAGNAIYFLLVAPHLPESARHRYFALDLGLVIDFWICLVVYGMVLSFSKKKR
jgi:hypothetical protein